MRVVIMGCGRVGSGLTVELARAGHDVAVIDKRAEAFHRLPPGFKAATVVGIGFDRRVLEQAGIKEADAFVAVSNGDNSNIVAARVALEYYKVPKVIARIYDPSRAEIYERLNIPTVSTSRWGIKQIMLMLSHAREELVESMAGGDLFRMRVRVPAHLVGKPVAALGLEGRILVAGVDRGGAGFIPKPNSTFQEGDIAHVIMHREALAEFDDLMSPAKEH
jgi:trk system potassium uptake protein TrkA